MIENNEGTLNLSEEAIAYLKDLDTPLSKDLLDLNNTTVKGYLDLNKRIDKVDLSIYDIKGKEAGCYLPFYFLIKNQKVLVNMDHMDKCMFDPTKDEYGNL